MIFLSELELRRFYKRFRYPATEKLYKFLKEAGYKDVSVNILENIERFCHNYQTYS